MQIVPEKQRTRLRRVFLFAMALVAISAMVAIAAAVLWLAFVLWTVGFMDLGWPSTRVLLEAPPNSPVRLWVCVKGGSDVETLYLKTEGPQGEPQFFPIRVGLERYLVPLVLEIRFLQEQNVILLVERTDAGAKTVALLDLATNEYHHAGHWKQGPARSLGELQFGGTGGLSRSPGYPPPESGTLLGEARYGWAEYNRMPDGSHVSMAPDLRVAVE